MKKIVLILLLIIPFLSFAQTAKDNYEIYLQIIKEPLNFCNTEKIDSLIIIEQYKAKFSPNFDLIDDLNADTIKVWTLHQLDVQTNFDDNFRERVSNELDIRYALMKFKNNFSNHPMVDVEYIKHNKLNIQTITSKSYYRNFGRKFRKIDKGWKRITKKFRTKNVVAFSKIKYYKKFATIYYEYHCGGLCGSGNILMFERINGKWKILTHINLWVS